MNQDLISFILVVCGRSSSVIEDEYLGQSLQRNHIIEIEGDEISIQFTILIAVLVPVSHK